MRLVPVINLDVAWRRFTGSSFNQLFETEHECGPFHTAVGREFDRFTPIAMAEKDNGEVVRLR